MDWFTENQRDFWIAFGTTVEMVVVAGIIALVLGSILAAMRVSPVPLARAVGTFYVYTVRNTPLLLIMFIFAFGIPNLGFQPEILLGDFDLLRFNVFFIYATVALGLYTAAFVCEALRSGINSISMGQAEAARAIGLTFGQTLRLVVLPQAFRAVLQPVASALIAMIKNSAVAVGVGVTEMGFLMKKLGNDYTSQIYTMFICFALAYMFLVAIVAVTTAVLERKVKVA
ncbi:MAG TPA: amino acid ABC transporter permease [Marmoricola sp.]|nr:amino acid ABC transporter permease [Marmoricola sp.]